MVNLVPKPGACKRFKVYLYKKSSKSPYLHLSHGLHGFHGSRGMTIGARRRARGGTRRKVGLFPRVPALIADLGDQANWRYVEFFTANINNDHTRRAYARA